MATDTLALRTGFGLRIGNRKTVVGVDSFADAKAYVNAFRNRLELEGRGGASEFPTITILDLNCGTTIGHASYNGRLWAGEPRSWTPTTQELQ